MVPDYGFWVVLVILDLGAIATLLAAPRIVSWHARMYKEHFDPDQLAQMDQMQAYTRLSRHVIGRMSDYANIGPDDPTAFPRMIAFIRILASALVLWISAAMALAVLGVLH
jgi:hypothetical protein